MKLDNQKIKRLLKSDPKILEYCVQRILSEEETAKILHLIEEQLDKKKLDEEKIINERDNW